MCPLCLTFFIRINYFPVALTYWILCNGQRQCWLLDVNSFVNKFLFKIWNPLIKTRVRVEWMEFNLLFAGLLARSQYTFASSYYLPSIHNLKLKFILTNAPYCNTNILQLKHWELRHVSTVSFGSSSENVYQNFYKRYTIGR
jgi:hypothetical protein